ncbi:hypothetical protein CN202_01680 [Sinorhizobium meliloti]|uniref:hypothetical protein n=1 Tax=Rhizobium meliloti TaxID=382 RepID=UPI000FD99A0B|nr:hypothetical protein [Sinorhizobium meliloti]RVI36647.1 hypothetical protein CN202_01680 [Sinorhizobium meliloti]
MTNPADIRQGDVVRVKDTAEHREYARRWSIPMNTDLVVERASATGIIKLEGIGASLFSTRLEKLAKKARIKGVTVSSGDIMAVLTRFVTEELSIDAKVEKVVSSYADSLELVFAEAA